MPESKASIWPPENRIDIIGQNGNTGEHYIPNIDGFDCVLLNQFYYRVNPNGNYALYKHRCGEWRESATITNDKVKL